MTAFDPEIRAFYERYDEAARLTEGYFPLEEARTRELMLRHLPAAPARVLDVGGAAGAYALWLAERGYAVHLVDPVPRHVEQARAASTRAAAPLAGAELGDARALDQPDGAADALLLMGPLYHLPEEEDRLRALREAARVLVPGGVLLAAAISRFASLFDGLRGSAFEDPAFLAVVEEDLRSGRHRNPTRRLEYFTTALFPSRRGARRRAARLRVHRRRPLCGGRPGRAAVRLRAQVAGRGRARGAAEGGARGGARAVAAGREPALAGRGPCAPALTAGARLWS